MAYISIITLFLLLPLTGAKAMVPICVICTAAVGAGVGLSRWLGVDDTITGLWIGGLTLSVALWTINWSTGKNIKFFGRQPLIIALYYALLIWPLYHYNMIGHPLNKLCGTDKLLLGITVGSIGFIIAIIINEQLKKKNGGRVYFPFQKVIIPVGLLATLSLALYLICAYKLLQ